jgi:PAP2 superfamily
MFPYWGKVRTFAISEGEKLAKTPIPYSESTTSPYYAQGLEVYSLTTPQSAENQWIAEFWSDDVSGFTFSPASRWLAIGNQILKTGKYTLETAVYTNCKVGMALNDASVACWHSKFYYNVQRPATYLNKIFSPTWNVANLTSTSFLAGTPSFPAYPSGHATFGGAAAEVLTSIFGADYAMADASHVARTDFNGRARYFNNFNEMADENGFSRIPLGVHWRMDSEEGVRLGHVAGRKVNALPFKR